MVGVPGKSKGCHTCRQRSIACSLERPQCAQCIKSNRVCAGYQRERIFIPIVGSGKKTVALTSSRPGGGKQDRRSVGHRRRTSHPSSDRSEAITPISTLHYTALVSLPSEVTPRAACRQQLFSAYLDCYVPFSHLGQVETKSWLLVLPSLPNMTNAMEKSMLALCASRLGRFHDDPALVHQSLKLYTQGLWELQKALWDPLLMHKDETVAACLALAMYELTECPAKTRFGYLSHHNGCQKLVNLRGPERCITGLGHQLFLSFRLLEVYEALEHHRPTYLTEPIWATVPWKESPKGPFDRLLDLLALAPDLLRQADQFPGMDVVSRINAELSLTNQLWKLDVELQTFYSKFEGDTLGPLYWTQFAKESHLIDGENEELFSVAFQFLNLTMASTLMVFWATQTMLWSGMCQLYYGIHLEIEDLKSHLEAIDVSSSPDEHRNSIFPDGIAQCYSDFMTLRPLEHQKNFISVARNVLQSVEYCMQEEMLGLGPSKAAAPLGMVLDVLKQFPAYDREVIWATDALRRVRERGLRILKYTHG